MHYPPHFHTLVADHAAHNRRVVRLDIEGRRVWAKHMPKNLFTGWHRLHAWLSVAICRLIGKKLPSTDAERIREEKSCMEALRKRGMIVPEIVHEGVDYLVLSDIGPSLQIVMQEAGTDDERLILSQQAAKALGGLHLVEGWHGSASLRDMTLSRDGIGFIDFEHSSDPLMPLLWLHFKDIWLLAHSVSRFDASGRLTASLLRAYPLKAPKYMLLLLSIPFAPLYVLLKPFAASTGRDVRQSIACIQGIWRSYWKA